VRRSSGSATASAGSPQRANWAGVVMRYTVTDVVQS
jgi:hypothetical protein